VIVTEDDTVESCPKCGSDRMQQDTDVLDTWFSSALWPFSTMGWPEETDDLEAFYPTDVLVTGFDILFFWVARMIMMGLRFTGEAPFHHVYLHGLVRDEHGKKMSKSRGNVIDPLEVADEFGADAVRFTLAILATGRDIPLAKSRMQGYSAFANKIWNAARFALLNLDSGLASAERIEPATLGEVDRWILSRLNRATRSVNSSLEAFRFDEAAHEIYHFFWHEFCDWYIEMIKPALTGNSGDDDSAASSRRVLLEVLDRSLRLLHPFMPYITDEIWRKLGSELPSVMVAEFPRFDPALEAIETEERIEWIQQITVKIRNLRAERGYAPGDRFRLFVKAPDGAAPFFRAHTDLLETMARLSEAVVDGEVPADAHRDMVGPIEIAVELPEKEVSLDHVAKIEKEIGQLEREIENIRKRLSDENFLAKAPAQVVEQQRKRESDYLARVESLRSNLPTSPK